MTMGEWLYKTFAAAWEDYSNKITLCRRSQIRGFRSQMPLMFRVRAPPRDLKKVKGKADTYKTLRYIPGPYVRVTEEDFQLLKLEETMITGMKFPEDA